MEAMEVLYSTESKTVTDEEVLKTKSTDEEAEPMTNKFAFARI